ncbi:MAG: glycosyltransferase family 4 protein, partial [Victivallales bacterium]
MNCEIKICSVDEEGRFGGPEHRITQVAKGLEAYGHKMRTHVVYPTDDSERFGRELTDRGITCSALNITRLSKEKKIFFKYVIRFIPEIILLYSLFRREKFDLVQANGSQQFKAAIAAKFAGIPLVWVLEDELMAGSVRLVCKALAKHLAAGVIVTGKRVYDYYIRESVLESKPLAEINPPVDTSAFDPEKAGGSAELKREKGRKIVTVSGINATKGLEYFIEMVSMLVKKYDDLTFYIAAPKFRSQEKYYRRLEKQIKDCGLTEDNIKFLGMLDDIPAFLKSADIFVFTSISESGPMSVWEAMAMMKPVVSTDVGAVSENMEDGESGFIVPIKNAAALCEKVEILLENPSLGKKMGERRE